MRRIHVLLSSMLLIFSASSFAFSAKVVEVVHGDVSFVKLDNGEVKFLDGNAILEVGQIVETETEGHSLEDSTYNPTILNDNDSVVRIFEDSRRGSKRRSECYNRAHVWAYEEYNRRGTKLNKTFLFFTNRYIREYRYKWWFHVAPSTVLTQDDGTQVDIVLDWTFFDNPEEVNKWTRHFINSGRSCPAVSKYSDYRNNQQSEDCYLIKASMYFWQPLDLEAYENTGIEKTEFISYEVKRAYRQAF